MARLNLLNLNFGPRTHEGAPARTSRPSSSCAARCWLACFGRASSTRTASRSPAASPNWCPKVAAEKVAALAVEAREQMKLRHAPLLLVREMARHATHRALGGRDARAASSSVPTNSPSSSPSTGRTGACRSPAQVKKGLAAAFPKFDEYALAKYDRGGPIKLRDVLFLVPRQAAR